jgi:hypothetical protein
MGDLININHGEMRCGIVDWIELAQDEYNVQNLANTIRRLHFPENIE